MMSFTLAPHAKYRWMHAEDKPPMHAIPIPKNEWFQLIEYTEAKPIPTMRLMWNDMLYTTVAVPEDFEWIEN